MCVEGLYSFAEAAELLNVPESTLRKKVAIGRAPHRRVFRHVRFNSADLQAMQDVVVPSQAAAWNGRRRSRLSQPASEL
jgi:excisionase family DNA binding protein